MDIVKKDKDSVRSVVIVTGCGSGIGFELAKTLYELNQYFVIATCRGHHVQRLQSIFGENENFQIKELDILNEENIYHVVHDIL